MAEIYADLVEAGERSLDGENGIKQVPKKYLEETINILIDRGYMTIPEILL